MTKENPTIVNDTGKEEEDFGINERIKELMLTLGLNANSFAIKLGVGVSGIHKILKKQAKPGFDTLNSIITYTKVSERWLMSGLGSMFTDAALLMDEPETGIPYLMSARMPVPLIDQDIIELPKIDARVMASFTDNIYGTMYKLETGNTYKVIKMPDRDYTKALVMDIVGDSMLPNFRHGMKVIVREVPQGRWDTATGIHAISTKDGMFTLKRITSNRDNVLTLKADNKDYPEDVTVQLADVLIMFRVGEIVYAPPVQDL